MSRMKGIKFEAKGKGLRLWKYKPTLRQAARVLSADSPSGSALLIKLNI
jgi:hypothetical protein